MNRLNNYHLNPTPNNGPALPEPYSYFTGELMQMSVLKCASLVHWLHTNVLHLLTVLLYSYFNYSLSSSAVIQHRVTYKKN